MIINLNELNLKKEIDFKIKVEKDDTLDKRIKDLKNSFVEGRIYLNSNNNIFLECLFSGTMIIDDSITLEPVPYDFKIEIAENLEDLEENYTECYEKMKNILDLKPILWQNIVLEVPISFTLCQDAEMKGNGWELTHEFSKDEEIDPRLKKLEDLLKGDD